MWYVVERYQSTRCNVQVGFQLHAVRQKCLVTNWYEIAFNITVY